MRTRSQQASPGGFLSLDDSAPRRTRSARSISQSNTQSSSSAQPPSRTRSQGTGKKAATSRAAKTQTRNGPQRVTRKSTRKTAQQTTDDDDHQSRNNEEPTQTAALDDKENHIELHDRESVTIAENTVLSEPKSSSLSLNRKRAHEDTSDEDRSAPVTPAANKRRNLGPPGSTPFANRRTPLSRRIQTKAAPFSARLARREAEKHGRIESTLFRLPDYLRQLEADRRKAERAPSSPSPQLPQTSFDFTMEPTMATTQDSAGESSVPQEPSTPERNTPETPQSGWNLRGLLSSVPRSFSRLLPFGRSSRTSEAQTIELSSERITRTRLVDTESTSSQNELRFRRRLSEGPAQPAKKRARNLSYSLFPAPIDRSLYLGDVPKPPTALPKSCSPDSHRAEQETAQTLKTQEITASDDQTKGREVLPQAVNEEGQKKRKRSPSPDVIPNPAGSSYGLDLDYFCYSSDSEDEAAGTPSKQGEPKKAGGLAETAARNALRSERASSKKVRFDASPEDTPSKLRSRARATDPYRGTHFIGMGNGSASAPTTPTPPARAEQSSQPQPGFIPNTQGTFQLDYDTFPDDSESSGPSTPRSAAAPGTAAREEELRAASQPEGYDTQSSTPRPIPRVPSTPGKVDEQALARVRSQAEKYKPKTPSGLRTTSRYSSPLTAPATSDTVADKQKPKEPSGSAESEKVEKPENFGDDEFARDAEWLYQNCPSGDLSQLKWPARQGYEESLGVSPASMQLLATIWDDSEIEPAYLAFRQSFEEFKKTSA
ncbi:hypothetical protein BDV23DRAFT_156533 [Aspergillus alliaceus]|uniref:Uncharacterized protein n=1 Tax=Petromyces alliaceus TaxID=209559 RepID=A0A5N7C6Q6_PETAA|nr:hypothetical protein BDV23DRAFT_156533 [Aspergillus alliaceus]